jgi:CubicO group peptidase (beta-lactamase class C family)
MSMEEFPEERIRALPLPRDLLARAVQGYGAIGRAIGRPGEEQGVFKWPGAGQIYSSSRDMATFLVANLGELPDHRPTIIDKNGGLPNTSTYIGFVPQQKLGVVILVNRGKQHATGIGRQILHALAQDQSEPSTEGAEPDPDVDDAPLSRDPGLGAHLARLLEPRLRIGGVPSHICVTLSCVGLTRQTWPLALAPC